MLTDKMINRLIEMLEEHYDTYKDDEYIDTDMDLEMIKILKTKLD